MKEKADKLENPVIPEAQRGCSWY